MQLFREFTTTHNGNGYEKIQPAPPVAPHQAPEISASAGSTAVLVLAMALAILRARRSIRP